MSEKKFISYYRVSTQKQAKSGLGLDAQKAIVKIFVQDTPVLSSYTDVESGTRKGNDRENLKNALEHCKKSGATLIIAKLDRLSRNVSFITTIMDSGVDFIACDMPYANKFTIHILAAVAEQEADLISQRTKSALAELKKQGRKMGTPENLTLEAIRKGAEIRKANAVKNENNIKSTALIVSMRKEGRSFYCISQELNKSGFKTRNQKAFQQVQVSRLYKRFVELSEVA